MQKWKIWESGNFTCGEYSHAQPLVSELPDGFGGECEPKSKAQGALGGRKRMGHQNKKRTLD